MIKCVWQQIAGVEKDCILANVFKFLLSFLEKIAKNCVWLGLPFKNMLLISFKCSRSISVYEKRYEKRCEIFSTTFFKRKLDLKITVTDITSKYTASFTKAPLYPKFNKHCIIQLQKIGHFFLVKLKEFRKNILIV